MNLGVLLSSQAATWSELLEAAKHVDRIGYDHLWLWDHLLPVFGDSQQPIFEGWTTLAALALTTERVRLGLMVSANTFRNPVLVAKMATTIDHASRGRAILGLGAAWFEPEHRAFGIDFGRSPGERLGWLDEAAGIVRDLLDGKDVTLHSTKYTLERARIAPLPLQARLPLMIGGSGERRTLRTVARYADMWNAAGSPEILRGKDAVLRRHCEAVGRNEKTIERTVRVRAIIRDDPEEAQRVWDAQMAYNKVPGQQKHWFSGGTPGQLAALLSDYVSAGFTTAIAELATPFDAETIDRLATEVWPLIARSNGGSSPGGPRRAVS
jgi:F420-dependent oxidoreductase-like protein